MHGLKTIHRLNQEAIEAREICEKHGVALGDLPSPSAELPKPTSAEKLETLLFAPAELPTSTRLADMTDAELEAVHDLPVNDHVIGCADGSTSAYMLIDYDLPNIDESGK